ncbi:MAG: hypothetical protein EBT61_20495 [Verrucomicrobia bacterium]|nr:hypothetical protein [Verrucomicrobiota bacterium]
MAWSPSNCGDDFGGAHAAERKVICVGDDAVRGDDADEMITAVGKEDGAIWGDGWAEREWATNRRQGLVFTKWEMRLCNFCCGAGYIADTKA